MQELGCRAWSSGSMCLELPGTSASCLMALCWSKPPTLRLPQVLLEMPFLITSAVWLTALRFALLRH